MFIALLVTLMFIQLSRARSWDSPFLLSILVPLSAILYSLQSGTAVLPPLSSKTKTLFIFGYLALLFGLRLKIKLNFSSFRGKQPSFAILLFLGLLPTVISCFLFGLPILASDVEEARANFQLPLLGQLYLILPMLFLVGAANDNKWQRAMALFANVFVGVIMVSRFSLFMTLLFWVMSHDVSGNVRVVRRQGVLILLCSLVAAFVFGSFFDLRSEYEMSAYQWYDKASEIQILGASLNDAVKLPYMYLVSPLSNFDYTVAEWSGYSYGAASFTPLLNLLQMDQLTPDYLVRVSVFNTNMFLSTFYMDFGPLGVMLLAFFLGVIITSISEAAKEINTPFLRSWQIYIGYATILLFFSNHFCTVGYPVMFPIIYTLISRVFSILVS